MSDLRATIFVRPTTLISIADYPHPDLAMRVVVVNIGDLSIHIGSLAGGDDEIVATTNRLIAALSGLRDAVNERLAATVTGGVLIPQADIAECDIHGRAVT